MEAKVIFFASYEIFLSLIFGLLTIFISYRIFNAFILKHNADEALKEGNNAIAIFSGSVVISALMLVQASIVPSVSVIQTLAISTDSLSVSIVLISFLYFLLFYLIATVISVLIMLLSTGLYMLATTEINEMTEIKNKNTAVAIVLSLVIIGMTFFIRPSVNRLIASFVNYETLEKLIDTPSESE